MFNEFAAWVQAVLGAQYQASRGQWVDSPALANVWIASIHAVGGGAVSVDDRRPRYRVILLGPRNGRQHADAVGRAADSLITAAIDGALTPCGATHLRAINEPTGPGYTTENRVWFSLDFEVTF